MAVTMADITKLRKMTGAGMMDCKNALTEADGDYDKAMEIIRKKGQAVAAKRSEREASEGCVLAKTTGDYAVVIALKCETDFVAQNADFVKLTQDILDLAVANKCKTLDEVKALPMGNGTVQDAVTDRSGITGEKMELDGYMTVEGASTAVYNHMNRNGLCTIVAFNKNVDEQLAKQVAMQIAAMNPIAIDEDGVSEEVKQKEIEVAIEKTKAEQVQKAVEAALKKANINPAHVDSEDHMESNMAKGWITAEDVAKAKEIIASTSQKMAEAVEFLDEDLKTYRAGKANPAVFNAVMVNYYGSMTPVPQVASINTPDAKTIIIQPWDKKMIPAIEKAIMDANIGFTPQNNGEQIRINVPALTEERRRDLVKKARTAGENAKISIRNARREGIETLRKLQKEGMPEDVVKVSEGDIQKETDTFTKNVDELLADKEKEIMTV